jgi:acetyl-CoA acyltransferase
VRDVVIVDALRTPIGRFRGSLASVRADHLATAVLNGLLSRTGLAPDSVDDVVLGCVTQIGEQCGNIARTALLGAGWPERIPGMTVDRKCGSAEAAIHVGYASIAAGVSDVIVAGGAESMSRVPMGSNRELHGTPFGSLVTRRYDIYSQGEAAERISDRWAISVADHDAYAMESHRRAAVAADAGYFAGEIVPIRIDELTDDPASVQVPLLTSDETIRRDTSLEKLGGLKRVFRKNGRVSAGNASQICDGAAAVLLMDAATAVRYRLRARARIRTVCTVGSDPELMLTGPVTATRMLLKKSGLAIHEVDLFEVNEAFASVPLIWLKEIGAPREKLNVNGGAIALGHPLGATGARIMTTMLGELERRGGRFGVQTICCAGGMATATLIERLDP